MRQTDIITAGLLVLAGLALIFAAVPFGIEPPEEGEYGLSPAIFPLAAAGVATLLSALLFATRLWRTAAGSDEKAPIQGRSWRFLAGIAALFAVIFAIFAFLGFNFGAPVVVVVFMIMMGERRPAHLIAMAVAVPLAIWLFFWKLLSFPLP